MTHTRRTVIESSPKKKKTPYVVNSMDIELHYTRPHSADFAEQNSKLHQSRRNDKQQ